MSGCTAIMVNVPASLVVAVAHFGSAVAGHRDLGAGDGVARRVHHVAGDGPGSRHLGRQQPAGEDGGKQKLAHSAHD